MGHAIRSRVVIDHLISTEGHEIEVVVSGRAHDVLQNYFPRVHKIWGLNMTYRDNEFKVIHSIVSNIKQSLSGIPENISQYFEVTRDFEPDCVISDFESWSYLYGLRHRIPVLCVDNIQMVARCTHSAEFLKIHEKSYSVTKNFIKGKLPGCEHYYVTTFFYPEVRKRNTTLVPPVLRNEILNATPSEGEHVLVYVTSQSGQSLMESLKEVNLPFVVYGHRRELTEDAVEENLTFRPFNESTFINDLASAKAVIANGGFTLMSESVYLHKPMLTVPVGSQFEQVLNGHYLEGLGFGYCTDELDLPTIRFFLENLSRYKDNLATYEQKEGNGKLFQLLDEHLDRIAGDVA